MSDEPNARNVNNEIWRKEVEESRQRNNKIMVMKWRTSALARSVRVRVVRQALAHSALLTPGCVGSAD